MGIQLLRRVLLQEERVPFEADQAVIVSSETDSDGTVTHEIHGAGRQVRVNYRLPKSAAGRLIVNNGKVRWEYDPNQHVAVKSRIFWRPATPSTVASVIARVCENYNVAADPTAVEIEKRPMDILRISPRKKDRNRHVWWVDRATGLVIKREAYDADGKLHFTSAFSNLRFPHSIDPRLLKFVPPKGVSTVVTREAAVVTSFGQAKKMLSEWGRPHERLGAGFNFESVRQVTVKGKPGIAVQYSDGLIGFAYVQVRGPVSLEETGPDARKIDLNGAIGTLARRSRFAVLSWCRYGISYNIVSDLSERLLVSLARKISTR